MAGFLSRVSRPRATSPPVDAVAAEADDRAVIDSFHRLYYERDAGTRTWGDTRWMGVRTLKCPLDLWMYQEIIHERRPDLIVECGTAHGGSGLFLAQLCGLVGQGRVLSIDIEEGPDRPRHPLLEYRIASTLDPETVTAVAARAGVGRVMVILDDDHTRDHVLAELHTYSPFVTPGDYLVVEDTNVNGHPTFPSFGPGPMEAVDAFLSENSDFEIDAYREKLLMTFNPRGYLRRRSPPGEPGPTA